jgi:hypothetical protein
VSMTAKDFVALADAFSNLVDGEGNYREGFSGYEILDTLLCFCRSQNPKFDSHRFVQYLKGKCGPRGGKLK